MTNKYSYFIAKFKLKESLIFFNGIQSESSNMGTNMQKSYIRFNFEYLIEIYKPYCNVFWIKINQ